MEDVLKFIRSGIRIFDGGMGSMLIKLGHNPSQCPELADKEIIRKIHKAYLDAGAEFITTNSFGATSIKLNKWGLADKVAEINKRAVDNCRNLDKKNYYIAGGLGPTGEFIEPYGNLKYEEMVEIFTEQAKALNNARVDLLLIETMSGLDELKAAIEACKNTSNLLPIIPCMTFNKDTKGFHTIMGHTVESFVRLVDEENLDTIGTNCSLDPSVMPELVKEIRKYTAKPLLAQPNAGRPQLINEKTVYKKIDNLETHIKKIIENGANVVGGCCGTDPEYIQIVSNIVKEYNKKNS